MRADLRVHQGHNALGTYTYRSTVMVPDWVVPWIVQ